MTNNAYIIDPFLRGLFSDETLEYGERVGLALREASKYIDISFDNNLLPEVRNVSSSGATGYSPDAGLWYNSAKLGDMIEKYPEEEALLRGYDKKLKLHYQSAVRLRSMPTIKLSETGAQWGGGWGGHSNPDYGRIVNLGTNGIRAIINEGKAKNIDDTDWFYRSCEYALEAIDTLGDRFRELAVKLASECDDLETKKRYERTAKAFEVVPREPAYDFFSGMMAFMLIFSLDGNDSPGRFDQYMYRAYKLSDNADEAYDLLSRLWDYFHDHRSWNLCISGSDENWNDMSNELTYLILKITAEKKYQTPNLTLRVHKNTPDKLWSAIADTLAAGTGLPSLYNDDVVCPALERLGIPPYHSHLYCMNGCNQIDIMGKSHMGLEDGEVIFSKCLEYALHNGVDMMCNEKVSIETGDPREFTSYEEFERAFIHQLEYITYHSCNSANNSQHMRAIYEPHPLRSCLTEGCIEKGRDYRNGGPLYNHGQILAEGIADTGDSLWAIKKLIFDEKKYTMDELIDALKADFVGYEQLHHDFKSCEKFGNDIEGVDDITTRIVNRFFRVLKRHHTYRGGIFTGGCSTFSRAADYGRRTAALPNGKRKGEPLLADSIAATPGRDTNGPTALIKSVLKYNHLDSCSGFVFQAKFDKKVFNSEKGKASFIALAKTLFAGGGQQYTVTVVNPEDLLDAKVHPENHRDLIVRVGGYSDYFVNLDEGLQDNVIERTFIDM